MKRAFGRGRYANVTSTVALVVALGGTAYAANTVRSSDIVNGQVKSADIGNKQVKNADLATNAVTSTKVRDGALLAKDFRAGELPAGPRGATGATGAPGAPGAPGGKGDKGDPGTAKGYALVDGATGAVTLGSNIASANVNRAFTGGYCISGLSFTPQNVVVTPESPGGNFDPEVGIGVGPSSCPAGTQVRVFLRNSAGALTDKTYFILLN